MPGSRAFCAAGVLMRMPIAIYPIGIVLIISARTGKYGVAGLLSACYILGGAVGSPLTSAWVDRLGQRRIIVPAATLHCCAALTFAALLQAGAPAGALIAPAVVLGFSYLVVGSLIRARWSHALAGTAQLTTAMSLESVLDELVFTIGPLVATAVAITLEPTLLMYLCAALVAAGSVWLAGQHASEPPVHAPDPAVHALALRNPGMTMVTVAATGMGACFASAEVASVALCTQFGQRSLSGLALAAIALGSAVSGTLYGAREHPQPGSVRLIRAGTVLALLAIAASALLLVHQVAALIAADFLLGLGVAPVLIVTFGLIAALVPAGSLTQGLSWLTVGLNVGYGVGASVAGAGADHLGARTAYLLVPVSAAYVALTAVAVRRRVRGLSPVAYPAGAAPEVT